MAEFIKMIVQQDQAITATQWYRWDMPVHPVCETAITIKAKVNSTARPYISPAELASVLDRVEVRFDGSAVNAVSGQDLYVINNIIYGKPPVHGQINDADDAELFMTLKLPTGRRRLDPTECWPAVERGALELAAYVKASTTNLDTIRLQIEAICLPGATPARHLRYTTISPGAMVVGENNIDIPVGNMLVGILLYSPTIISGTDDVNTIEQVQFIIDGFPRIYPKNNWESLVADLANKIVPTVWYDQLQQRENTASSYTQNALTKGPVITDALLWHYALLDFCPTGTDDYLFDLSNVSRCQVRIIAGDTGSPRLIPLELVAIARVGAR